MNGRYGLEQWIRNNPTWNYLILDGALDYKILDHQLNIRFNAFRLAYYEWLDYYFR